MSDDLSLDKYCVTCGAQCCRMGGSIGPPILSHKEFQEIMESAVDQSGQQALLDSFSKVEASGGIEYYIPDHKEGSNECIFLTYGNRCKIQHMKPLDCQCYPIKARLDYMNGIEFVIDTNCSAVEYLTPEFIKKAKEIALKSIIHINNAAFRHWVDHFEIWVKDAVNLEEFLESIRVTK
jgi:Fe-S-cluster containining protein